MRRAVLVYRRTCRKCRVLSICAMVLAFGAVRRIPHDSAEAAALGNPGFERGVLKVTLLVGSRRLRGAQVLLGVALAPLSVVLSPARRG